MNGHIGRMRAVLAARGTDAMLVTSKTMKRWLGTLTGSGCKVLVTRDAGYLIVDGRYANEAKGRGDELELIVHEQGADYLQIVRELLERNACGSLGVEADEMLVGTYRKIEALGVRVDLLDSEVPLMRIAKDADEVAAVQRAVDETDKIYERVVSELHVGMTDYEISALLQYHAVCAGAEKMSFDTIVGLGPHSALPHGRPCGRTVQPHEPVLMDFGIQLNGYQSDMTRVVFLGEPTEQMAHVYETVLAANLAGIAAIRTGAVAEDVDAAAREVIAAAGYGDKFTHGLGHGIGVDTGSDWPLLRRGSKTVLGEGMIMSCEPGVYLPGVGGVRIEDDVVIRDGVGHPMNATPKALRVIEVR